MTARLNGDPHLFVFVRQLNPSQWEPVHPTNGMGYAVSDYVEAVATGMWMAALEGFGLITVDLACRELLFLRPARSTVLP